MASKNQKHVVWVTNLWGSGIKLNNPLDYNTVTTVPADDCDVSNKNLWDK